MDNAGKYQGKYRIPSARWREWDYGADAAYFVTICTASRKQFLGGIVQGKMQLSAMGRTARGYWLQIPVHFPFVLLDQFVIMPNHIHGIIVINKQGVGRDVINHVSTNEPPAPQQCCRDAINGVSTNGVSTMPITMAGGITGGKNPMLNDNLSRVVRWYKGRVTFEARQIHAEFGWQTRFYDRVIRDYDEWQRTAEYIYSNPHKWYDDELFEPP